jgi:ABC-type nickel/cobalt efflux system permease component RcnA
MRTTTTTMKKKSRTSFVLVVIVALWMMLATFFDVHVVLLLEVLYPHFPHDEMNDPSQNDLFLHCHPPRHHSSINYPAGRVSFVKY